MSDDAVPNPRASSRDRDELRERLGDWLRVRLGDGADPRVSSLSVPEANGMSSETFLFDLDQRTRGPEGWSDERVVRSCVGRMEPDPDDDPVFPVYDLPAQAAAMRVVADRSNVPVPTVHFIESDPAVLGAPFIVMARVDGRIPPDVMPYTFEGWLVDATVAQRTSLQDATVRCLAVLHQITPEGLDPLLTANFQTGESALRQHFDQTCTYVEWVAAGRELPLVERALGWLRSNWPTVESPPALSWGDARIGNVIYDGFEPVALLDWEMVAVAPPEVDVGWLVFMHRFFQDLAVQMGLVGLPGFLRLDDVRSVYDDAAGTRLGSLDWYVVYAALRHAVVMTRVGERMARQAGTALPSNLDELIMHRPALEGLLDGSYQAML